LNASGSRWELHSADRVSYFQLTTHPDLLVAFLTRRGGLSLGDFAGLNLSATVGDDSANVRGNHELARRALDLPTVVTIRQVHSDTVWSVDDDRLPDESSAGDALYTGQVGIGLGIKVADCLPIFLWARDLRCVGVAHCGWHGTVTRLARKLALTMGRRFNLIPADLLFALGPSICADCYPVGTDVADRVRAVCPNPDRLLRPAPSENGSPRHRLDLRAANRRMLTDVGLTEVAALERCTFEHPGLFYSARRDRVTGRNLAVIALRSGVATDH
jgi:YfiH family protein